MGTANQVNDFDVIILGAGPGGCSCALALKNSGLKVAMIDKSEFPRGKVCGELIHKKAIDTFNVLIPGFEKEFSQFSKSLLINHTIVHYKGQSLKFDWNSVSYTCRRTDLDAYLLDAIKQKTSTAVFTGVPVDAVTRDGNGVKVMVKNSDVVYTAKVIVGADGANSMVARQFAEKSINREHYLGAVRAYYRNIKDLDSTTSEVFFNTKYRFNYLWVFPVAGGEANVGFGLLSKNISNNKINLKDAFYEHFKESPELGEKFRDAEQTSALEGFGVPLGPDMGTTSGDRFVLIGDAASLSNPLSGTGIGNAVVSGRLAGEHIVNCFKAGNFGATIMKQYDAILEQHIIKDLMTSMKVQNVISKVPFLLDIVFFLGKYKRIKQYIQASV